MEMTQTERILLKRIRDLEDRPSSGGAEFLVGKLFEQCRILEKRILVLEKILRGQGQSIPEPEVNRLTRIAERHPFKIRKHETVNNLKHFRAMKRKAAKART
jgi:hypothetical protein